MPRMPKNQTEAQRWDRLFAMLKNLSNEVVKLDENVSAVREQLSQMAGRIETIEEAMLEDDDEEEEESDESGEGEGEDYEETIASTSERSASDEYSSANTEDRDFIIDDASSS